MTDADYERVLARGRKMTIDYPNSEFALEPFDVMIVSFQGRDPLNGQLKVYTDPGGIRTLDPAAIVRVR